MVAATEQDGRSGAQAVERVLTVLEAVASGPVGLGAGEIASITSLGQSTTYRLLGVLVRQGYVVRNAVDHRYKLGRTVGALGIALQHQVLATAPVRTILEAVRDELRAPVYLTAFEGDEVVVAFIADSPDRPRIGQLHVGFSEANHATAFGKLLLASKGRGALDEFLQMHPPKALTRWSLTGSIQIREQLDNVRREQLAVEVEEYMPHLACIAAPVRSRHGQTIGAVSVSVSADDFRSRAEALSRVVRRAAWHVSSQLAR